MVKRKRLIEILDDDPVKILKKTKRLISKLKKDNRILKEQIKILLRNNKTLTELVEVLEERILEMNKDKSRKHVYSYERGGWVVKNSVNKRKIELKEEKLSLSEINEQLSEMIRLMKIRKVRNLRQKKKLMNSLGD
jgi:hypothetical protein